MTNNPKISIIIPIYNPGKHLYRCLDSITNQTYKNLEIILVDDGSSDGSDKVCDEYQSRDARIKVKHIENGGVSHARNVGIEMATGDYVYFPDSDDYLELNTFEMILGIIEEDDVDAVCFEYYTTYEDRELVHRASDDVYGIVDTEGAIRELLFSNRPFLWSRFFTMEAIQGVRFYENIVRGEDCLFEMMVLHNVRKCAYTDKPMYHYVQSEESACRGEFRPSQLSAIDAIPIVEEFLEKNYPSMLSRWRVGYLHLMIMLYVDMSADAKDWKEEKSKVFNTFKKLKKDVKSEDMGSFSKRIKLTFFETSPKLFCKVHNKRFNR